MTTASRPPDDTTPWIECPDCRQIVNQVASATLDLALSQHQLWACKVRKVVAPLKEEQRIALGLRPRTVAGWWFWFRYWSPVAFWLKRTFDV